MLEPWVLWFVLLPSCSSWFICKQMWDCLLCQSLPHPFSLLATPLPLVLSAPLPISAPPTGLEECFFFNSFIVGLPYSSIFCQFWLFLFLNLLLSFFWLCEKAQCVCLYLHLGWSSSTIFCHLHGTQTTLWLLWNNVLSHCFARHPFKFKILRDLVWLFFMFPKHFVQTLQWTYNMEFTYLFTCLFPH